MLTFLRNSKTHGFPSSSCLSLRTRSLGSVSSSSMLGESSVSSSTISKTQKFKSIRPPLEFLSYLDKIQIGHIRDPIKRKTGRISGKDELNSMDGLSSEHVRISKSELKRNFREKYRNGNTSTTTEDGTELLSESLGVAAHGGRNPGGIVGSRKHLPKPYPFDISSRKIARFLKADYPGQIFPNAVIPEVVAIGRSNAGKSTLINSLLGFKAHVQQSAVTAKPGETRSLHFYGIPFSANEQALALTKEPQDDGKHLSTADRGETEVALSAKDGVVKGPPYSLIVVDMPGFGFSYMNEKELYRCKQLCFQYLCTRGEVLKSVMLCVDARHGLKLADKQFFTQLLEHRLKTWKDDSVKDGTEAEAESDYKARHAESKRMLQDRRVFPWDLNIVLTKCDLVDRAELGKRMIFIKEEVQQLLDELKTTHGLDKIAAAGSSNSNGTSKGSGRGGKANHHELKIFGFVDGDDQRVDSLIGHIFPVSALGQSSLGHKAGVVGGTQCKGMLSLQQHLSGIVDHYLPFSPYIPPMKEVANDEKKNTENTTTTSAVVGGTSHTGSVSPVPPNTTTSVVDMSPSARSKSIVKKQSNNCDLDSSESSSSAAAVSDKIIDPWSDIPLCTDVITNSNKPTINNESKAKKIPVTNSKSQKTTHSSSSPIKPVVSKSSTGKHDSRMPAGVNSTSNTGNSTVKTDTKATTKVSESSKTAKGKASTGASTTSTTTGTIPVDAKAGNRSSRRAHLFVDPSAFPKPKSSKAKTNSKTNNKVKGTVKGQGQNKDKGSHIGNYNGHVTSSSGKSNGGSGTDRTSSSSKTTSSSGSFSRMKAYRAEKAAARAAAGSKTQSAST